MTNSLTADRLRELLRYDSETGMFFRLQSLTHSCKVGEIAGSKVPNKNGYILISVDNRLYYAHRLAWLYTYGRWPTDQTDHKNGNRSDNRIANLRECSQAENSQNMGGKSNNKSGVIGVHLDSYTGKWRASIRIDGKTIKLGRFNSLDEAAAAYRDAKKKYHQFQPIERMFLYG